MTNQQINDLIAERVMGWRKSDDFFVWCKDGEILRERLPGQCSPTPWSPSTDMNDAMEAVEEVRESGWFSLSGRDIEGFWEAEIVGVGKSGKARHKNRNTALCLAMLRAVGVEVEA